MMAIRGVSATRCCVSIMIVVGLALAIDAECPVQSFVFRGRVIDRSGASIAGASIGCVLDQDSLPDQVITDADGSFVLRVSRGTHAGTSCRGGDKCRPAESVSINVRSGQRVATRNFAIRELGATVQGSPDDLEVPTIEWP